MEARSSAAFHRGGPSLGPCGDPEIFRSGLHRWSRRACDHPHPGSAGDVGSMSARIGSVDPLIGLLDLPGVAEAIDVARGAVDEMLWNREVGRRKEELRAESAVRGAWASAWFEGAETGLAQLRTGAALDESPVGRLLANALALHIELPVLVGVVGTAPNQALARMHALAAHGFADESELGRPRTIETADDALRIGALPGAEQVGERMGGLSRLLVSSTSPGLLVAAVAHAEVAALRPFGWGSGLVARALIRLVLAQRGVDPEFLVAPEVGLRSVGRPAYVRAVRGYAEGTPEGVAAMLRLVAGAVERGAREPVTWLDDGPA